MVNGNSYMMIMFSFYQKKIIQSIESAKWLPWRKVIVIVAE